MIQFPHQIHKKWVSLHEIYKTGTKIYTESTRYKIYDNLYQTRELEQLCNFYDNNYKPKIYGNNYGLPNVVFPNIYCNNYNAGNYTHDPIEYKLLLPTYIIILFIAC